MTYISTGTTYRVFDESLEATYVVSERVSMDYRKYPKKVGDLYLYLSGQSLPHKEVDRHTTHIFP